VRLVLPVGYTSVDSATVFHTQARATPDPARVGAIQLSTPSAGSNHALHGVVSVRIGSASAGAGYNVTAAVYQLVYDGSLHMISSGSSATTQLDGNAAFDLALPAPDPSPGTLYLVVQDVTPPPGGVGYARGLSNTTVATIAY
jgi:hypothetical protein